MRLRLARKLVRAHGRMERMVPKGRFRRAGRRYLRWRWRPKAGMPGSFHWLDEMGRIQPPPADLIDGSILWEMSRHVRATRTPAGIVSTIFLGLEHSMGWGDGPQWFETAIIRDGDVSVVARHPDKHEAMVFHFACAEALRTGSAGPAGQLDPVARMLWG